jgi:ribosomal protein S18 acetylase RimI-like enzyme
MTDTSRSEIKTDLGFEEKDRESLVDIMWPAFHTKADWIYKNDEQKEREAMRELPVPETTIVARINDKVVGFLIFQTSQSNPKNKPLKEVLIRHRNWRTLFFILLLAHMTGKDEFYIFMVAVSEAARGKGIGSELLHKAYEVARGRGLKYATLNVIEENQGAKRLYNREGFVDVEHIRLPGFLQRVFSFKGAWLQRKDLV